MIQTGIESRVKIQDIISNQLPEYVLGESPKTIDFLKQYYISQEYQGGPVDIAENLDQYLKVDNLTPEVVVGFTTLSSGISTDSTIISVPNTKGFPKEYGLLKIDDEIITYTGLTTNTFIGCIRGFSGITSYHQDLNAEELIFSDTTADSHVSSTTVHNLSSLFLKEFYKKLKSSYTPGFEDKTFDSRVNAGNFIKSSRSFYESKGTNDSFKILFNVLYGETPKIINLEEYLIKPSDADFIRKEICVAEAISGDITKIVGQTLTKSTDPGTYASISSVEIFTREQKQYFKIGLFVGYGDNSNVQGNFIITPNSKVLENVSIGANVISVDSTIGFGQTGTIYSGNNTITYSDKSINQFLGCSGVTGIITATDNIFSDDTYFSYENGDTTKKVVLKLSGILSDFIQKSDSISVDEGQVLTIKSIGTLIKNPEQNKTYREIFANSWIYNTSPSIKIDSFIGGSSPSGVILQTSVDRSQLKKGDRVEFIDEATNNIIYPTTTTDIPYVNSDITSNSVYISNLNSFPSNVGSSIKLRRKINKANSSTVNFKYQNNSIISDIQNMYVDDDNFAYIASNSLPSWGNGVTNSYSYQITKQINSESISSSSGNLIDFDEETGLYSTILFDNSVPFISGERIQYESSGEPLTGLKEGSYYVKVLSDTKQIKLYTSSSFLYSDTYAVQFKSPTPTLKETHTFTLYSQKSKILNPQKILKKFSLNHNIKNGISEETVPGSIGMLINGVEISNYKTFDKVYYGPIEDIKVLNGGRNFDVINVPNIQVSTGIGITSLVQPVITGTITDIVVDKQDFDIKKILSVNVTGGNGSGGFFNPVLIKRRREVLFDARATTQGGGISTTTNQLTFLSDHNFVNGQRITYRNDGNESVSIGIGLSQLSDNANYFAKIDNNTTIRLFNDFDDYLNENNQVGFATTSLSGTHKFLTEFANNTISEIKVIEGGSFTNRKLLVKPAGISTIQNSVNFKNHGFNNGEIVEYGYETSQISGITTENQYYVLKHDENSFRLCDAGIGGTNPTNYERENYEKFDSIGSGFQEFKYPDIKANIEFTSVGIGTTTQIQSVEVSPVVKGHIEQIYVYEPGTGYGSNILNLEKKPSLTIKTGRDAQIIPIIVNGSINQTNIQFGGYEYFSTPDLIVSDPTNSGNGAKLRAVVTNQRITGVKIINAGIGYSTSTTTIKVVPSGSDQILDSSIRELSINQVQKIYPQQNEILKDVNDELSYSVTGYFQDLKSSFNDNDTKLSNIIGWAYDGNPIYGPYSIVDSDNINSGIKTMTSGYVKDASNIFDRPSVSDFPIGFFVEDYVYNSQNGDLDKNNGRFVKTKDFPDGVYAYHAVIDEITGEPQFPYFIGNSFRSNTIDENQSLNQGFDFDTSSLSRNTLGYKILETNASNDFIIEDNGIKKQRILVESIGKGSVSNISITNSGDNYKVNELLNFNNDNTNGGEIHASVSSLKGKNVDRIDTSYEVYNDALFTWGRDNKVTVTISPFHTLLNGDNVLISGFGTSHLTALNDSFKINVPLIPNVGLTTEITSSGAATTEIYVSQIPPNVSVGSSVEIGNETLEVLNIYPDKNIFRVKRGNSGIAHTTGTAVSFKSKIFTIDQNLDYFESKVNDRIYFNPQESVGFGTTAGIGYDVSYSFGQEVIVGSIPTQRISIKEHSLQTNQKLTYSRNSNSTISISTSPTGTPFNLPTTVYAVNKSPSTIGIKTSLTSDEVFFISGGEDKDNYYFDTNYTEELGKIEKITSTVSISTSYSHGLVGGDSITMDVKPNLSVGIGTSTVVNILHNSEIDNILVNPIGFNSTGINTITNEITIENHGLKTGDRVYYESDEVSSGLNIGKYFIYKVDTNNFKLSNTLVDINQNPPVVVSFASTGGSSQTISPINPRIESIKNNNLVFDLTDSSLSGYEFKLYYDQNFNNEFISTGSTETFSTNSVGTIGISTDASFTINYSSGLPERLYYSLEKSGYISSSDKNVSNFSEILFVDSTYNQTYNVFGVGSTTFQISLQEVPEKFEYISSECDNLEYTTTSTSSSGPVNRVKIISGGSEYKKLPLLSGVDTVDGENLFVSLNSNTIGKIKETKLINENFTYSSDMTLRPHAFVSPRIKLKDSNIVGIVTIISGGSGYTSPPKVVVVNNNTRNVLNSGSIIPIIIGNSITNLIVDVFPKGISDQSAELFTINNSNGISIKEVESSSIGIFTCSLTTPLSGFSTDVFTVGEEVFVEGIQKFGTTGDGFNSSDYGYKFFEVTKYDNALYTAGITDDKVTVSISGLGTNTGIAKTIQDSFGTIISKTNYPTFSIISSPSEFEVGEKLLSNGVERDLEIIGYDNSGFLKVSGSYDLSPNEVITGKSTGNIATIESLTNYDGIFDIKFSNRISEGWRNETGKLSEDFQVLQDSDYYQNLSYSVKSRQQWNDIRTPVNSLVHSIGIKNFSDTEIISDEDERIGITSFSDQTTIVRDYIQENRIDTINNFVLVNDVDVLQNKSKFLKLKNKKLTNYQESKSNIVLKIDDISKQFSHFEDQPLTYKDILKIDDGNSYNNYLFKVSDISGKNEVQLTSLVFLNDSVNSNIAILEKQSLVNVGSGLTTVDGEQYGEFSIEDDKYLRFTPKDPYDTEYDIKYIDKKFDNQVIGIGTISIGFIDLTSRSQIILTGVTSSIIGVSTDKFVSFYVNAQIYKEVTNEMNFVELYLTHDGTNTNISEFYFDTEEFSRSSNLLGSFDADISGSLNLNYTNNTDEDVIVKTRIVGFGTTSVGVGTFRYILPNQPEGNERSAIYEAGFSTTTSGVSTSFLRLDKNTFDSAKSIVEVSIGSTKSIHQVMMVQDNIDIYTQQYSSLSIGSTIGIGTFGGEYSGDDVLVKFYPDSNFIGDIRINSYSECLYTTVDVINQAPNLLYGNSIETVNTSSYLAINGDRINKDDFILKSNNIPIFAKSFNPSDSNILDLSTGKFSIDNHFFSNNEELIYTPKSTFVGIGSTSMMYKNGSINEKLPSQVFAIVHNSSSFSISTTKAGSAVTFTSVGEGNEHVFSMAKRDEKSIITIDNIAQYPLTFTKISQSLSGNGGGISTETTTFTLSGITTIFPLNILRIDDEYMNIINVGLGTTNVGPITNIGTELLVEVERGFIGSSATSHVDGTQSRIYKGSYTIVDDSIYFTKAPRGNINITRTDNNLIFETSDFTGRVFLREDYTANEIYDDISDGFNGIGRTFTLTVDGANTAGIGTTGGNGVVFINGIFQTPTTENNPENNFHIIEQLSPTGISSIVFSGIRTDITDPTSTLISESDINQNQIPRGGLIVSLGSTGGLGYAPLVGAKILPTIAGGAITGVVGVPTYGQSLPVSNCLYDNVSGIVTITTSAAHNLDDYNDRQVWLEGLEFSCAAPHAGVTTTIFPDGTLGNVFAISDIVSATTFSVNVGTSTIPHTYDSSGQVYPYFSKLNFGSGYSGNIVAIGISVYEPGHTGDSANITAEVLTNEHKFWSSTANNIHYGGQYAHTFDSATTGTLNVQSGSEVGSQKTPNGAEYNPATGALRLIFAGVHGMSTNDTITIDEGSLKFKCARDNFATVHAYPRPHDPIAGITTAVTVDTTTSFTINVGRSLNSSVSISTASYEPSTGDLVLNVGAGHGFIAAGILTTNTASYIPSTGLLTVNTTTNHGMVTGERVQLANESFTFKCAKDNYATEHTYPRSTDPSSAKWLAITKVDADSFTVFVGESSDTSTHTFVRAELANIRTDDPGGSVGIHTRSLTFTCAQDNHGSFHAYPRASDPIHGAVLGIGATTTDTITINAGTSVNGTGGQLKFTIVDGGTGYSNQTQIFVSEPTYENLEVVGVSRIGSGSTTDTGIGLLLDIDVDESSATGIGSTYFEVKNFYIARSGYSFRKGDVFKPVGLVTGKNLTSPISEFELTVLETFSDNFRSWQFGELDYIDSVKNYQDGERIRFPLKYNGSVLSFEKPENSTIELQNVLLIIINGVIQDPGVSYVFDGGTSFAFTSPPKPEDQIDIFYYRGTRGVDDIQVDNVIPTLEKGDDVRVFKNDSITGTITQDQRTVFDISFADKFETSLYLDQGIDEVNSKPMSWTKQKIDRAINGEFVYKTRQSTIAQIYPTAKIIKDVTTSDSSIFVDAVSNFNYDESVGGPYQNMGGIIVDGKVDPSPANITASIGAGGIVSTLTIADGGNGYVGSTVNIKFQSPIEIGVGIGTIAQATGAVTNGVITGTTITNPGFGYTAAPKTIIPLPDSNTENIDQIEFIKGFSGIITGITTTSGSGGHSLALEFFLDMGTTNFGDDLEVGYPIFVKNTIIGSGVISVDSSNAAVVGIGTAFLDNIYYIHQLSRSGDYVGIVTCNIDSGTNVTGLSTSGDYVGEFSWGLFTSITRSSAPISIGVSGKTFDVGLSTFPTIQRRGEGIRLTGALPETKDN